MTLCATFRQSLPTARLRSAPEIASIRLKPCYLLLHLFPVPRLLSSSLRHLSTTSKGPHLGSNPVFKSVVSRRRSTATALARCNILLQVARQSPWTTPRVHVVPRRVRSPVTRVVYAPLGYCTTLICSSTISASSTSWRTPARQNRIIVFAAKSPNSKSGENFSVISSQPPSMAPSATGAAAAKLSITNTSFGNTSKGAVPEIFHISANADQSQEIFLSTSTYVARKGEDGHER
jgi:hypothetical protein